MKTDRAREIIDEYDMLSEAVDLSIARMSELRLELAAISATYETLTAKPVFDDRDIQGNARVLADWIRGRWEKQTIRPQEVVQYGPVALRKAKDAIPAMERLEAYGMLEKLPNGSVVDGAVRRMAWAIK